MISSTSSSSRALLAWGWLALGSLAGCAATGAVPGASPGASLRIGSLVSDAETAPVAGSSAIRWTAVATGGAGELRYRFLTSKGSAKIVEQEGPSATWDWHPTRAGAYRVRAEVRDEAGAAARSPWSAEVVVAPAVGPDALVAVLPVENLSGGGAPLDAIVQLLRLKLSENGFRLLEDESLEDFMRRYRIRNTGGLSAGVTRAMREEIGAEAFLVTSLEAYRETSPVQVSLIARLVSTAEPSAIVWMDGVGLSAEGHPGFLGLAAIDDPGRLLERALGCLADSLAQSLWKPGETPPGGSANSYRACDARGEVADRSPERRARSTDRPRIIFRAPTLSRERRYSVALIPFLNLSDRKNAGEIVGLHFVDHLIRNAHFEVVEPGRVREQLLAYRIVMEAGPSFANAEVISSDSSLGVDLVFSGTVFEYQDAVGVPRVDYSLKILEGGSRKLVWSSRSGNDGDDGVFFFDVGRIYTAHRLASEMAWGTCQALTR
jgi:TolB-like protein